MPQYWLMKSEPDVYSISDLERDRITGWEGVRNYQARNFMRDEMREGDLAFFYHSNAAPSGIAGIARIHRTGLVDEAALDSSSDYFDPKATREVPRWYHVEVEFVEKFLEVLSLQRIREVSSLADMPLINKSRLSVQPVSQAQWDTLIALAQRST